MNGSQESPLEKDGHERTSSPTNLTYALSDGVALNGAGAGDDSGFTAVGSEGPTSGLEKGKGRVQVDGLPVTSSEGLGPLPLPPYNLPTTKGGLVPDVIVPTECESRTLVLCFDGTGDQFDSDNSNIVELFSILLKNDPAKQMVYYQAGIGTYTVPQVATPLMAKISKTLDEMIAWNIDAHIIGGYEFLMQNYKAGDKICIFGFSRGSYTARCLAGMIHKVGLLPAGNHQQVPFAYKMYTSADPVGWKQSNAFKAAFSSHVDIDFLGVWDTVNSVGIIPRRLPFTTSNTCVRVFRHAVALDERRAKFKQNGWNRPTKKEAMLSETDRNIVTTESGDKDHVDDHVETEEGKHEHTNVTGTSSNHGKNPKRHYGQNGGDKKQKTLRQLEREYSVALAKPTDVEEVWFAGCHCDVGGGSVLNGARPNLARIPLRWMIRQTFLTNTGIMYHARGLQRIGLDLDPTTYIPILVRPSLTLASLDMKVQTVPRTKVKVEELEAKHNEEAILERELSENDLDVRDALSPIYDQLSLAWFWWVLEVLPMKFKYQRERSDEWTWDFWKMLNLGRGRHIARQERHGVKVHRSVKIRMEAKHEDGTAYWPKANMQLEKVTWVD